MFFRDLMALRNYTVKCACLEYVSPATASTGWNKFWKKEEGDWDEDESYHCTDVTWDIGRLGKTPDCIKNAVLRIGYAYDGKEYECVTSNTDIIWPPKESEDAVFSVPLTQVMLLDEDGVPVRDVTGKLKPMMGPRKDFHGEDVLVEDLFFFDDYTDIEITNALNIVKIVNRKSSCLQLL